MTRIIAGATILLFVGVTLILSELRPFRQQTLSRRVSPYLPGGTQRSQGGALSVESFG